MKSKRPYFLLIALALIYHIWHFTQNKKDSNQELYATEFSISKN